MKVYRLRAALNFEKGMAVFTVLIRNLRGAWREEKGREKKMH